MRMRALASGRDTRERGTTQKHRPQEQTHPALRANAQQTEHQRRRHKAVEEDQGEEKSGGKMERSERSESRKRE